MVNIKNIIYSQSAPNNTEVGWLTIEEGKPKLKFNINGVWTEVSSISSDTETDTSPYVKVIGSSDGAAWIVSIPSTTNLDNPDDEVTYSAVSPFNNLQYSVKYGMMTVEEFKNLDDTSFSSDTPHIAINLQALGMFSDPESGLRLSNEETSSISCSGGEYIVVENNSPNITLNFLTADNSPLSDLQETLLTMMGYTGYVLLPQTCTSVTLESGITILSESNPLTLEGEGMRLIKYVYFKNSDESMSVLVTVEGTNFKNNQ